MGLSLQIPAQEPKLEQSKSGSQYWDFGQGPISGPQRRLAISGICLFCFKSRSETSIADVAQKPSSLQREPGAHLFSGHGIPLAVVRVRSVRMSVVAELNIMMLPQMVHLAVRRAKK